LRKLHSGKRDFELFDDAESRVYYSIAVFGDCREIFLSTSALIIEFGPLQNGGFMRQFVFRVLAVGLGLLPFTTVACNAADRNFSAPVDASLAAGKSEQTAVLIGGCFWGIQAVFQHVNGVISATSGYSGGSSTTAQYEML